MIAAVEGHTSQWSAPLSMNKAITAVFNDARLQDPNQSTVTDFQYARKINVTARRAHFRCGRYLKVLATDKYRRYHPPQIAAVDLSQIKCSRELTAGPAQGRSG